MRIIIGHIALLEEEKRQEIVIRTVYSLYKRGYDAYGVFAGKGNSGDRYIERLHSLVDELSINQRVIFLGYRTDIPDILKCLDVIMIPASFEGFPLAGLEACCAGVPSVACDVGGAKEFIEVSHSGECFRFDDYEDAASKVISCINNKNKYGNNGIEFAKKHTLQEYSESIMKCFTEVE